MPVPSRILDVATAAVGLLEFARPGVWGRPAGIHGPSAAMRTWHHTLGARDVASGLALTFASAGPALRAATLFRIVSDLTNAIAFAVTFHRPLMALCGSALIRWHGIALWLHRLPVVPRNSIPDRHRDTPEHEQGAPSSRGDREGRAA